MRESLSLHKDWRFHLGDFEERNFDCIHKIRFKAPEWIKSGNHGLSKPHYPDDQWRLVDLPHDYVVEAPFSPEANTVHGSKVTDIAWYRKTFLLDEADQDRRILIEFDGIYRDSQIWVNGHFIGRHLSGYTSCNFDISEVCNFGGANTIAVRTDANGFELWSYEGGGIYRDARLLKVAPIHIPINGTFVYADITKDHTQATVTAEINICNELFEDVPADITATVVDAEGQAVASLSIENVNTVAQETTLVKLKGNLSNPQLWGPDTPTLYTLKTEIHVEGASIDQQETVFGLRYFHFDPKEGFFLNGQHLKLLGVCEHQDHAGVGTAISDELYEWRVKKMLAMGINAIRTSHNPAAPGLLRACDRLGVMVIDEARMSAAADEFLDQLSDLIVRDRNHPSVILWSLGNEEMVVQDNIIGVNQFRKMQALSHKLDPTRPTNYAMNCLWLDIAKVHNDADFRFDVFGTNYTYTENGVDAGLYDEFHKLYPDWPLIGSECGGSAATRGLYDQEMYEGKPLANDDESLGIDSAIYVNPERKGMVTAYNDMLTPWGTDIVNTWKDCASRPFMAGTFLWTGFDYRGETYPFGWPAVITRYGLVDLCGFPKDAYYYYQSCWRKDLTVLHLLPHWNWDGKEGTLIDVRCYTNCAEVELWHNDSLIERKVCPEYDYVEWKVPYAAGTIEARGFNPEGEIIKTTRIETTGQPKKIAMDSPANTLKNNERDVLLVNVALQDEQGRTVPTANDLISFEVTGPAQIIGVGNGNPTSHESDKAPERKAFHGLCQVVLQSTKGSGNIELTASGEGLKPCRLLLVLEECQITPFLESSSGSNTESSYTANPVDELL